MDAAGRNAIAIVLSAGKGSRMHSGIPKQYLKMGEHPVLYYSLKQFSDCPEIDEIILVAGSADLSYCRDEIVDRYALEKVTNIVPGGAQRYESVWAGLQAIAAEKKVPGPGIVLIHDGARPFIDRQSIVRSIDCAGRYGACAVGVPVKDTIKQCTPEGKVTATPDRSLLWQVQTPQTFSFDLIYAAYEKLMESDGKNVTDDAMVVEKMTSHPVYMTEGTYTNLKITTPEDLLIGEMLIKRQTFKHGF